jgi:hypothetical protein
VKSPTRQITLLVSLAATAYKPRIPSSAACAAALEIPSLLLGKGCLSYANRFLATYTS